MKKKQRAKAISHTISIVRNRGQLTIPDSIRELRGWVSPNSVVSISSERSDEIIIRPHQKGTNWDKLWKQMEKVRSFKGKNKGSLSEFIAKDREMHF